MTGYNIRTRSLFVANTRTPRPLCTYISELLDVKKVTTGVSCTSRTCWWMHLAIRVQQETRPRANTPRLTWMDDDSMMDVAATWGKRVSGVVLYGIWFKTVDCCN